MVVTHPCTKIEMYSTKNQSESITSTPDNTNTKQEDRRIWCGRLSKTNMLKILGTFLVPFVIGVFTVVTTIQEYQVNNQNRLKDLEIAFQQRAQDQRQADELEQETVYAVYIKDIGALSLKLKTENLSDTELEQRLRLARAKSLSALRQFDTKRKSHLIQFLYETQFLFTNRSRIDLGGSDLSGITLTGHVGLEVKFDSISLSHVILSNTSFVNLRLIKADFRGSMLTNTNFSNANLYETNFSGCDLRNADLRGVHARFAVMKNVDLSGAILVRPFPVIENAILPNGSYVFYSDDGLKSDKFNSSVNLITNGDVVCANDTNSLQIAGWQPYFESTAVAENYSRLPLFSENISTHDCVLWDGRMNNPNRFLHQTVYLDNYTRLIDSGNASYEFSFDTRISDTYNDSASPTIEFRAQNGRSLSGYRLYPVTNVERNNSSVWHRRIQNGTVPRLARRFLVNFFFIEQSNDLLNKAPVTNIKLLIERID